MTANTITKQALKSMTIRGFALMLAISFLLCLAPVSGKAEAAFSDGSELFEELSRMEFYFSSGAGGWGTTLYINTDGRFFGVYHDSEMGLTGPGYPNGSRYYCPFYGKFTIPGQIEPGATGVRITMRELFYHEPMEYRYGEEVENPEILNGVNLIFAEPYGLNGEESFLVYFPEQLRNETSEEFRLWVRYTDGDTVRYNESQLGFFALCSEQNQYGFSGREMSENKRAVVQKIFTAEAHADAIADNAGESQAEMNVASEKIYQVWDNMLNELWMMMQSYLEPDRSQYLLADEMAWIEWKEESARNAAAEVEGGSLYPTVYYFALADRTRWRCYDFAGWLYP